LARELKKGKASCLRRRKFIHGALYDKLWPGYKIIDLSGGFCTPVEIVVTLANKKTSVVRIGSAKDESVMLNAIVELGKVLPTKGNARGTNGDIGDMFALGYRSLKKSIVYKPTKECEISEAMAKASTEAIRQLIKNNAIPIRLWSNPDTALQGQGRGMEARDKDPDRATKSR
jgi:hypothetical protein